MEPASPEVAKPRAPRRDLLQIFLDPRNIQMLLAFGGTLMVVGLVILLWINEFFTPPVVAMGLGVINAGLLGERIIADGPHHTQDVMIRAAEMGRQSRRPLVPSPDVLLT